MKSTLPERLQTVIRTGELSALHKEALRVPREKTRARPPKGSCRLASQYLLDESRFNRREAAVLVDLSEAGTRVIDVECAVPDIGWGKKRWYLPLAFFPKKAVAPNLEVTDEAGTVIPIPTKHQNNAFTNRAIDELIQRGRLEKPRKPAHWELVHEVITTVPHHARVCRLLYEHLVAQSGELIRLLRLFEENFVLWVPVEGPPLNQHQFRIARQEIHPPDPMVVRRPVKGRRTYETAVGSCLVELESAQGRLEVRQRAVIERVTRALAVRPIEAFVYDLESRRATSSHLRVTAPQGFVVRNVRVGEIAPAPLGAIPKSRRSIPTRRTS